MPEQNHINSLNSCLCLLGQQPKVHHLSLFLTFLATIMLFLPAILPGFSQGWFLLMLLIITLGLYETATAIRIGFDFDLLQALPQNQEVTKDQLRALDTSLSQLKLIAAQQTVRNLDTRLLGSVRLFKQQVICTICQYITLVIALTPFVF